jgi:hypothetical protein
MSGKRTAVSHKAASQTGALHAARSHDVGARAAVNKPDASARWAALDSRHERLVTASDAVLADLERKDDRRMAS